MNKLEILEQKFNKIALDIKESDVKLDNNTLLVLYKYFKQASIGDINVSPPNFWELKEKAKYDAWTSVKGMTK